MLQRFLRRWREPPPTRAVAGDRAQSSEPAGAGAAPAPGPAAVAGRFAAWHLIARRPLIDGRGGIGGWELRLSDFAMQRLARAGSQKILQETYAFALLEATRETLQGDRRALLTLAGLAEPDALLASLTPGTIVVAADGSGNPPERMAPFAPGLRRAGVKLAAPVEAAPALQADYALLDAARLGSAEALRRCRQPAPAPDGWIATNLGAFEEVAEAIRHRVTLASGRLVDARERRRQTMAPPAAANIAAILNALVAGASPRQVADLFKSDPTLSFRLLRYLGMAGVGAGRKPGTIQDAVILLGARELHRWLCVMLADAGVSPLSRALHETALTRGRLMESIATLRRQPAPERLFMLGAFSLLDLMLDVPMDVALALLPLPEPAIDALIAESGPWRPYLETAIALEAGDFERLDAACQRLGVKRDDVVALYDSAAQWSSRAASLLQQLG